MGKLDALFDAAEKRSSLDALFDEAESAKADPAPFMSNAQHPIPIPGVPGIGGENISRYQPQPEVPGIRRSQAPLAVRALLPTTFGDKATHSQPIRDPDGNITGYVQVADGGGGLDVVGDLGGSVSRAAGSLGGQLGYSGATGGDKGFLEGMADPETGLLRPAREDAEAGYQQMLQDTQNPVARAALQTGRFVANVGSRALEDPTLYLTAGAPQVARAAEVMAPKVARAGRFVAEAPNRLAGRFGEELSGVPEEALRMAGTEQGRQILQANAGKEAEIGNDLLERIDNAHQYMPEREAVDAALRQMPEMDLRPAIDALERAKPRPIAGRLAPHEQAAVAKIDRYIDYLRGGPAVEDLTTQAEKAGGALQDATSQVDALTPEARQAAYEADKAARAQVRAQSQMGKKAAYIQKLNKFGTNFGWWGDQALQEARDAAAAAREAATQAEATGAVSGMTQADLDAAKRAAEQADKRYAVLSAANQLKAGASKTDVAKALVKEHNLRGDALRNALADARDVVANAPEPMSPMVSAPEYRAMRQRLDVPIDFNTEEGSLTNSALKAGRGAMKEALMQKAIESGNPEYVAKMRSWSAKLDKLDQIKDILGKNGAVRERRVQSFIDRLFGKNSEYKQQLVRDLDEIFGSNIMERAKAADMAQKLGDGGKASFFPRHANGRSNLAFEVLRNASLPISSPLIASRLTLPMAARLEKVMKATGGALSSRGMQAVKALERAKVPATQAKLLQIIEQEAAMPANAIPFRKVADQQDPRDQRTAQR